MSQLQKQLLRAIEDSPGISYYGLLRVVHDQPPHAIAAVLARLVDRGAIQKLADTPNPGFIITPIP